MSASTGSSAGWTTRATSSAPRAVESNVKEIYDRCQELAADPQNVILNQFAEFGNHVVHYLATGARTRSACSSRWGAGAGAPAARVRLRDRLRRDDRGRRLPEGALRLADRRLPRRSSARRCF